MATNKAKQEKLRNAVEKVFKARTSLPGLDDLVSGLLGEFGGVREFARTFKQHYDKTDSPMTKSRMLEAMMRLVTMAAGQRAPSDMAGLTDDDLRDAAAAAVDFMGDDSVEIQEEEAAGRIPIPGPGDLGPAVGA